MSVEFWNSLVTARPFSPSATHLTSETSIPICLFVLCKGVGSTISCAGAWPMAAPGWHCCDLPLSSLLLAGITLTNGAVKLWVGHAAHLCLRGQRRMTLPPEMILNFQNFLLFGRELGVTWEANQIFLNLTYFCSKEPIHSSESFLCVLAFVPVCLSTNPVFITCLQWCPISLSVM